APWPPYILPADCERIAFAQRASPDSGHDVNRRASHYARHIEPTAYRQIRPSPGLRWTAAHRLAALHFDGSPQRHAGAEIRAGERHYRIAFELELSACERHLERGRVLGIADQ